MKKNVFNFDEAISLMAYGAHGFKFQSQRGDTFAVSFDYNQRLQIEPVETEGEEV